MSTLATLDTVFGADTSGFSKGIASMENQSRSFASKAGSLGKTMSLGLTAPIIAGFGVAISEATEFAQVSGQTAAAIRSTGGAAGVTASHVEDLAAHIGALSAIDGELVQAGENVLLTFTNIRNEAGKGNAIFDRATLAAANLSARLGTDLNGAMTLVGKALNDPIKGLTALSRVGVSFTDQQRSMISRLVETGDTMKAQKLILAELNTEFGGSARAMGAAASPFTELKLAALDFAQSIGQILLPFVKRLSGFLSGLVSTFQDLSPGVRSAVVAIGLAAAAIGPLLIGVSKLVSAFGVVKGAVSAVSSVLAANPYVAIAAATIAIGTLIVTHWDQIKEFLAGIWETIKGAALALWNALPGPIKTAIEGIGQVISTAVGVVVDLFKIEFEVIKTIVQTVWDGIKVVTKTVWPAIKAVLETVIGVIKSLFEINFAIFKTIVTTGWEAIKTVTRTVWGVIKTIVVDPLTFIWDKISGFFDKVRPAWRTFWDGIKSVATGIWDAITGAATTALNGIISAINLVIHAVNALIHGFNAIPFHDDVATIPTIPHVGGDEGASGVATGGSRRGRSGVVVPTIPGLASLPAGRPTVMNFNVAGHVLTEDNLAAIVDEALARRLNNNGRLAFQPTP